MKTNTRLAILCSIAWMFLVIAFVLLSFFSIPSEVCNFYIQETLGGAAPPASEIPLQRYESYFLSCGMYTDILFQGSIQGINNLIIHNGLQLVELNVKRVILVIVIPPVLVVSIIYALRAGIRWVEAGSAHD